MITTIYEDMFLQAYQGVVMTELPDNDVPYHPSTSQLTPEQVAQTENEPEYYFDNLKESDNDTKASSTSGGR